MPIVDSDLGFPLTQINDGQQPIVKGQKIDFSKDEVYLGIRLGSHTPDLRVILTESIPGKFVGYLTRLSAPLGDLLVVMATETMTATWRLRCMCTNGLGTGVLTQELYHAP